jgi:hypothetical protein
MCQIRSAYSRTLRSLEKMPIFNALADVRRLLENPVSLFV